MNDIDTRAQAVLDANRALKESQANHNYRAALAESQMREKCWRVAAMVSTLALFGLVLVVAGK